MGAFVYMLLCSDRSYYVGSATGDDYPGYTFTRRPVHLLWSEHFSGITDTIAAERQIKRWSRAKKEALAKGEWPRVQAFAKRRGGRPLVR
jgi:putative endonuclease